MIIIFVSLLIVSLFVMVLKPDILMDTSGWPLAAKFIPPFFVASLFGVLAFIFTLVKNAGGRKKCFAPLRDELKRFLQTLLWYEDRLDDERFAWLFVTPRSDCDPETKKGYMEQYEPYILSSSEAAMRFSKWEKRLQNGDENEARHRVLFQVAAYGAGNLCDELYRIKANRTHGIVSGMLKTEQVDGVVDKILGALSVMKDDQRSNAEYGRAMSDVLHVWRALVKWCGEVEFEVGLSVG